LLVLLKGNDVWVYGDSNMKALPESYEMRPAGDRCDYEFQAIIAFAGGVAPPASRRTKRETLASLRSHQANVPIMPICQ
jgi:hypothetical protein